MLPISGGQKDPPLTQYLHIVNTDLESNMENLTSNVGARIREVRQSQNISQESLASLAKINRTHMGRIERGDKSPTVDTVEKIGIALNCPPSILFVKEL